VAMGETAHCVMAAIKCGMLFIYTFSTVQFP
jgi:hypothetical protein